jgi:predicted amidohydrolase
MIIFKPGKDRTTNYKNYLHPDEYPFFVRGESTPVLQAGALKIGLAICYEISVTEHTDQVIRHRPGIFVASVAKSGKGIGRALDLLAGIAETHSIPVLMANAVGTCDGEEMAGLSSIWDGQGLLKGRLDKESEGILVFDSLTSEMISQVI